MERAFGQRLDGITVRVGAPAETAAVGAGALTQGDTIVFGQERPHREAVAHEVAHVVQTRQATRAARSGVSVASSGAEREAHDVGKRVAAGASAGAVAAAPDAAVHRGPIDWLKRKFGKSRAQVTPPAVPSPRAVAAPAATVSPTAPPLPALVNPLTKESTHHGRVDQPSSEFHEGNSHWKNWEKKVTYAAQPADAQRYGVTANPQTGVMTQGGQRLDTTKAKRTAVAGRSADGRSVLGHRGGAIGAEQRAAGEGVEGSHMFVMTPTGEFKTADQAAEEDRTGKRVHHSTFEGGGSVAAAGEMIVRDGKVAALSDRSGHYKPSAVQTNQAVNRLGDMGTSLEQLHVELGGKNAGEKTIDMSGVEMHGWTGEMQKAKAKHDELAASGRKDAAESVLKEPEQKIRAAHAKKDNVLDELKRKTAGKRRELDGAPEVAAPATAPIATVAPDYYQNYAPGQAQPAQSQPAQAEPAQSQPAAARLRVGAPDAAGYSRVYERAAVQKPPALAVGDPGIDGYARMLDGPGAIPQQAVSAPAVAVGEPDAAGYSRMLDGPGALGHAAPAPRVGVGEPDADGYARMLDGESPTPTSAPRLAVGAPDAAGYSRMLER